MRGLSLVHYNVKRLIPFLALPKSTTFNYTLTSGFQEFSHITISDLTPRLPFFGPFLVGFVGITFVHSEVEWPDVG